MYATRGADTAHGASLYEPVCFCLQHPGGYPETAQAFHEAIKPVGDLIDFSILKSDLEGRSNALGS